MALLQEATKLSTLDLVPDVRLIHLSTDCWKGKDWPFNKHFDNLLELANHGVLHANQVSFIVATLSSPFQTKPGINLKTQTLLKSGFHFAQSCRKFHFFKDRGTACGSSSRLGGPKGDAFSHVSRWPV